MNRAEVLGLYKSILRLHRSLPMEFKILGDRYCRQEFRNHKSVTDPGLLTDFIHEWKTYKEHVEASKKGKGKFK